LEIAFLKNLSEKTRSWAIVLRKFFIGVAALTDEIARGFAVWLAAFSDCLAFLASWRLIPLH
jgi:hypothetical protein